LERINPLCVKKVLCITYIDPSNIININENIFKYPHVNSPQFSQYLDLFVSEKYRYKLHQSNEKEKTHRDTENLSPKFVF
jgi:hypothetical protein